MMSQREGPLEAGIGHEKGFFLSFRGSREDLSCRKLSQVLILLHGVRIIIIVHDYYILYLIYRWGD